MTTMRQGGVAPVPVDDPAILAARKGE